MKEKIELEIWFLKQLKAKKKIELFDSRKTQGQVQELHRDIFAINHSLNTLKRIILKDGNKDIHKTNS